MACDSTEAGASFYLYAPTPTNLYFPLYRKPGRPPQFETFDLEPNLFSIVLLLYLLNQSVIEGRLEPTSSNVTYSSAR